MNYLNQKKYIEADKIEEKLKIMKRENEQLRESLGEITNSKAFKIWQKYNNLKFNIKFYSLNIFIKIFNKIFFLSSLKIIEKLKAKLKDMKTYNTTYINTQYKIWRKKNVPNKKD